MKVSVSIHHAVDQSTIPLNSVLREMVNSQQGRGKLVYIDVAYIMFLLVLHATYMYAFPVAVIYTTVEGFVYATCKPMPNSHLDSDYFQPITGIINMKQNVSTSFEFLISSCCL